METQLAGTTLCIEPRSVRADVVGPEGVEGEATALKPELRESIETALRRADVPYDLRDSCAGQRASVRLSLEARYLDPETYIGFPEDAYTYVISAQVGTFVDAPAESSAEREVLEQPLYAATRSDIVSLRRGEAAPLLEVADATLGNLVQAWREENVVSPAHRLIFCALGLLLAGVRVALRLTLT